MTTDVATQPAGTPAVAFNEEQMKLLGDVVAPGLTPPELALFSQVCQRTGLDPFAKQVYAIKRNRRRKDGDKWITEQVMTIQTSIDGFRLIAQRSGRYAGQTPPQWCGQDGKWVDVWLKQEAPAAARVGVYAKGFAEPLMRPALWREFAQRDNSGNPTGQWKTMPSLMLVKTAEAQALRAAFPAELSGIYTEDEMGQADVPEAAPAPAALPQAPAEQAPAQAPRPSWGELMETLAKADGTVEWDKLVAQIVAEFYEVPLSDDNKRDLRPRVGALVEAMVELVVGGDFPPPEEEEIQQVVASVFDGLLVNIEPFIKRATPAAQTNPDDIEF